MEPINKLTLNFNYFLKRLNPSPTYVKIASSAHSSIRSLIEDKNGSAGDLRIRSFIQGSYGRDTAIHSINDIDIVALCSLSYKQSANQNTRNQIFETIASSIATNSRYEGKIYYEDHSMCIKVKLEGITVEILPALRVSGKSFDYEPFYVYRPKDKINGGYWDNTYARKHQELLTMKNSKTEGSFIPMIKILKHIRLIDKDFEALDAVSFHIECLLYAINNSVFTGSIAECIENVLTSLAGFSPLKAVNSELRNPCGDELVFSVEKWSKAAYTRFHNSILKWHKIVQEANRMDNTDEAIAEWKKLLGDTYFPKNPQ